MNLVVEIIDGEAYAVEESEWTVGCVECIFWKTDKCQYSKACKLSDKHRCRRLTADERVAVQEALGRGDGIKYLYTFQWKSKKGDVWYTPRGSFPTLEVAKMNRDSFLNLNHNVQTRMVRMPIGKWEVVK